MILHNQTELAAFCERILPGMQCELNQRQQTTLRGCEMQGMKISGCLNDSAGLVTYEQLFGSRNDQVKRCSTFCWKVSQFTFSKSNSIRCAKLITSSCSSRHKHLKMTCQLETKMPPKRAVNFPQKVAGQVHTSHQVAIRYKVTLDWIELR